MRCEQVEEAEQVGYARTARNERIHICRAVPQLAPCPDEESAAEDEDHGCSHDPLHISCHAVRQQHLGRHEQQRQCGGPDGAAAQRTHVCGVRRFGLGGGMFGIVTYNIVSGLAYGLAQLLGRAGVAVVLDRHLRGGEVHGGAANTFRVCDGLLDASGAGGAAHSRHGKYTAAFVILCHDMVICCFM